MNTRQHPIAIAPGNGPATLFPPVRTTLDRFATDARRTVDRVRGWRADVVVPVVVVGLIVLAALVPAVIAPFGPTDLDRAAILSHPSARHWAGTDHLGRDMTSLIIFGARQSLLVALCAVAIGTAGGAALGLASSYGGRLVDAALTRLTEIWLSIPDLLLVIVLATALTPSIGNVILTIGLVMIPRFARIVRAQVIALKHRPYVAAARALGASEGSILVRHVLPHTLSPLLVMATLGVAGAALMAAMLSFLGLGVIDDIPDWGYLVSQSRSYLTVAWWMGAFPGAAIIAFVVAVNVLGDRLRARFDPRSR
jgi:peptide/nickel transport system permease protein